MRNPLGPTLITLWIKGTLCLVTFSIWITAADPWWRPKELALLAAGLLWLVLRQVIDPVLLRSTRQVTVSALTLFLVTHFFITTIWPSLTANNLVMVKPLELLILFHIVIILVWYTDSIALLRVGDLASILRFMTWIGAILSVHMIFQFFYLDPLIWLINLRYDNVVWLHENHVIGMMGGTFQASAVLAVLSPVMLATHPLLGILALIPLLMTQSAGGLAAACLGGLIVIKVKYQKFFIPSLLILASVLLVQGRTLFSDFLSRFAPIWKQVMEVTLSHPVIGHGIGSYKMDGFVDATSKSRWVHNEWIQFAYEGGFLLVILAAIYTLSLFRKSGNASYVWKSILVSTLFLSLFNTPFHQAPNVMMFLLAAIALTIYRKDTIYVYGK